jgi:hypothetical protein
VLNRKFTTFNSRTNHSRAVSSNYRITSFTIITSLILFGLSFLCYWLPSKNGQREIGLIASIPLGLLVGLTFIGSLEFLVIFIWPVILAFQIVFLTYWTFRNFGLKKAGFITGLILTTLFLLVAMSPWIEDFAFNNKDAKEILSWQKIKLNDDFEILKNESGGFSDYAHSFKLKISQSDYDRIANMIRSSKNYKGLITDLTNQIPTADYRSTDTVNYETENYIAREYYTKAKMEDGTYHFLIKLSKKDNELNYFGINE